MKASSHLLFVCWSVERVKSFIFSFFFNKIKRIPVAFIGFFYYSLFLRLQTVMLYVKLEWAKCIKY